MPKGNTKVYGNTQRRMVPDAPALSAYFLRQKGRIVFQLNTYISESGKKSGKKSGGMKKGKAY